jgi:hypothetical protein
MADLATIESEVTLLATDHLAKRWERFKGRKVVLFPWLAYRRFLRRIHRIKGCCCK